MSIANRIRRESTASIDRMNVAELKAYALRERYYYELTKDPVHLANETAADDLIIAYLKANNPYVETLTT